MDLSDSSLFLALFQLIRVITYAEYGNSGSAAGFANLPDLAQAKAGAKKKEENDGDENCYAHKTLTLEIPHIPKSKAC
jgi:hypothetical protein